MPLIETKGAASAQGFGEFAKTSAANYIEDVFSTYLYTGNGYPTSNTQSINNGIDLATKGGLVWIKARDSGNSNTVFDTARGATNLIYTNLTSAQSTVTNTLTSFNANGFSLGTDATIGSVNDSTDIYTSWTFRKQPKFFDVVTYTGDGTTGRQIAHSLGSAPGCIIIKKTSAVGSWIVYHQSLGTTKYLALESTSGASTFSAVNTVTSTYFVSDNQNASGETYVAYLFAHNAGGFGLTGTDNVISCGSYTGTGAALSVSLGWEPQFVIIKPSSVPGSWYIVDNMRGWAADGTCGLLASNSANAETNSSSTFLFPTATGFGSSSGSGTVNGSGNTYIYIAIRRGPMKTPTDATKVFTPTVYTGTNVDNRLVDTTIAPDMVWVRRRDSTTVAGMVVGDRLRAQPYLLTGSAAAEVNDANAFDAQIVSTTEYGNAFSSMNGFWCGNDATAQLNANTTSNNHIAEAFKRAPGFFDVVCYTGTGSATTVTHNLGVAPEMMMVKRRNSTTSWWVYDASTGNTKYSVLNTSAIPITSSTAWNDTTPTSSQFTVGTSTSVNASAATYVAYLFATLAGVSKVGSYTGTGTTLQINCGFTNGARLVLIKRTDDAYGWHIWDSARGIVAGNDPYLLLNSTNAEVTNTDYVDTYSAGFEISSTAPADINANGGSFIFLAIA